jgi:hypothetical protein
MMRSAALLVTLCLGCATATRFHTEPEGATVVINGLRIGETPLTYENEAGLPRRYHLQIHKEGYAPLDFYLDTRLSWLWGYLGVVTIVPFFWAWSLRGDYVFTLQPDAGRQLPRGREDHEEAPTHEERL